MEKHQKYIIGIFVLFIIGFALFLFVSKTNYNVPLFGVRNAVSEEKKNGVIPAKIKNPENNKNGSGKGRM